MKYNFKKIYVEITNICNKNCSFCLNNKRKKEEMSINKFSRIINEIKPYTNYIYLHVKGEPLLHSKLDEILYICDINKIKVNITTNGSLISEKSHILANHSCIRQINISLHSYEKSEDIKGLLDAVSEIQSKNKIYFVYRYWVLKSNENLLKNKLIKEIINFYSLNDEKIEEIKNKNNIKINEYTYINKDKEFIWPDIKNNIYNDKGYCLALKSHIAILCDGTVVPCCLDGEGIMNLGNIFNSSLSEILNSNYALSIIDGFKQNKKVCELCKHCSFNNKK